MIVYDSNIDATDLYSLGLVDYATVIGELSFNSFPMKNRQVAAAIAEGMERVLYLRLGFVSPADMRYFAGVVVDDVEELGMSYKTLAPSTVRFAYEFGRNASTNADWHSAFVQQFAARLAGSEPRTIEAVRKAPETQVVRVAAPQPTSAIGTFDPDE